MGACCGATRACRRSRVSSSRWLDSVAVHPGRRASSSCPWVPFCRVLPWPVPVVGCSGSCGTSVSGKPPGVGSGNRRVLCGRPDCGTNGTHATVDVRRATVASQIESRSDLRRSLPRRLADSGTKNQVPPVLRRSLTEQLQYPPPAKVLGVRQFHAVMVPDLARMYSS